MLDKLTTLVPRAYMALLLDFITVGMAIWAWLTTTNGQINLLHIGSLLGVIAFSLMWAHYILDTLYPKEGSVTIDQHYYISRVLVLTAILAHPFFINWYLISSGFGFPPSSYLTLLGANAWLVLVGILALLAFIAFELKKYLSKYRSYISHLNVLAMYLVLVHGFVIGMVMMETWYRFVWWVLFIGFTVAILVTYRRYYVGNAPRRLSSYIVIGFLSISVIISGIVSGRTSETAEISNVPGATAPVAKTMITIETLKTKNGLDGNKCWVALNGKVYDTSNVAEWQNGQHAPSNGMARCGEDLTSVIGQSPHGTSVLARVPVVGKLQ